MGNSQVKKHIELAQKTCVCNLAQCDMTEFPGELLDSTLLKKMKALDLSSNKLPSIPPAVENYEVLKSLILENNKLRCIPDEIGKLVKLEILNVSQNLLNSLPSTLCHLKSLREINASKNSLQKFPTQLGGLRNLCHVNLAHNRITEIPDGISSCEAVEINLDSNQISKLSEEVSKCSKLKVLRLEENCLALEAFTPHILKFSKFSTLTVNGNIFDDRKFRNLEGYEVYMERFTATKKKM